MKRLKTICYICAILALMFCLTPLKAEAYTAQQIVDSVIDELDNVSDYTADFDADFDDVSMNDMSGGSFQWKRNTGSWKVNIVEGSPYTQTVKTDGSGGWNLLDTSEEWAYTYFPPSANFDGQAHNANGLDMFNMENILEDETWTKGSNETVNSIVCYHLYTTKSDNNYEVWIDTATRTKVIRTKATDGNDNLRWQLDYTNYSEIESTAQLPATIVTKRYNSGSVELESTFTFSNIDINQSLADSIFAIEKPNGY